MYKLRLYIVDHTPRSQKANKNLQMMLEVNCKEQYSLEIIDLFENPELANRDKVFATPTVVRHAPEPVRRVVGDIEDPVKVLGGLELPISS
jgi:circadian clock protein KaiB